MKRLAIINIIIWSIVIAEIAFCADLSFTQNLSTMAVVNGKPQFIKCPDWDWQAIYDECAADGIELNHFMIAFNCVPKCGKYDGDRPDIGAYEYVPNITAEKPWGDYNGVPLDQEIFFEKLEKIKKLEDFWFIDAG